MNNEQTFKDVCFRMLMFKAGGSGHDAIKFVQKFPESAGRIVVQDQPQVITTGNEAGVPSQGVKLEAHDIFKPQPIQGMPGSTGENLFAGIADALLP